MPLNVSPTVDVCGEMPPVVPPLGLVPEPEGVDPPRPEPVLPAKVPALDAVPVFPVTPPLPVVPVGELLAAHGLPTRAEGIDPAAVLAATQRDKKRLLGADVPFVLVDEPGAVRHGASVSSAELEAAIAGICA